MSYCYPNLEYWYEPNHGLRSATRNCQINQPMSAGHGNWVKKPIKTGRLTIDGRVKYFMFCFLFNWKRIQKILVKGIWPTSGCDYGRLLRLRSSSTNFQVCGRPYSFSYRCNTASWIDRQVKLLYFSRRPSPCQITDLSNECFSMSYNVITN